MDGGWWGEVRVLGERGRKFIYIVEEEGVKREKGEAAEKHFKVTKIDHLADSCTMGGSGKTGTTTEKNSKGAITSSNTDDKMTKKEQEKQKSASSYPK